MRQSHRYAFLYGVLAVLALTLAWARPEALEDIRNFGFDTFQRLAPPPYEPDKSPVRVLAIDEGSLARLGQWPWPRSRMAEIIQRLGQMGASAIAFDILFAEPDRTSLENVLADLPDDALKADLLARVTPQLSNDGRFAEAIGSGPVVLGVTMQDQGPDRSWTPKAGFAVAGDDPAPFIPDFRTVVLPVPVLMEAAGGLGATNWLPDHDQIVRKVPLFLRNKDHLMPSLAIETLRALQGASTYVLKASNASGTTAFGAQTGLNSVKVGDVEIETGANGAVRPRYTHTAPGRFLPAADLLAGTIDPEAVKGKVIFVGTTAIGLGDVRATPLDAVVPGVEVHAQVLEGLLSGRLLSRPDWSPSAELAITVACFLGLGFLLPRVPPLLGGIVTAWIITLFTFGAWLAFDRAALLLDPIVPSLTIAIAYLCGASVLWQMERRAKREVRVAFGKYLAPAVVARIAENPDLLKLRGENRNLTILFSDLRNFSTISESLEAHQVAHFLNLYLTPMTDTILRHDGTVDKYIGDAIVAFWNAPLDVPDHTTRAVEAALAMRAALALFNRQNREMPAEPGRVLDVRMGIGLNYGQCSVGNMGSTQRFDYSALGDPVNVAARLEALTKTYGVDLLATVAVWERTPNHAWLEIDEVKVKGRSTPTKLFTLAGDPEMARSPAFADWSARHDRMLEACRSGRLRAARQMALALAEETDPHWRPLYESLAKTYAHPEDEETLEESVSVPVGTLLAGPNEAADIIDPEGATLER